MSNSNAVRAITAQEVLDRAPPLMQKSLIRDPEFGVQFGIKMDPVFLFGDSGIPFLRSVLFDAVRKALAGETELNISDYEGNKWLISIEVEEGRSPKLVVSNNEKRFFLPDLNVLSPSIVARLQALNEFALDVNLPVDSKSVWHDVLSERALEDEEVDELPADCRDTPIHVARYICGETQKGKCSISVFVPASRRYFDRLIGAYDGSASVDAYAAGVGKQYCTELIAWQPYDGFLQSLFLSAHLALTTEIDIGSIETNDLVRAFEFLEKHGDRLSQLGAIEIGLRCLPERPEIEPFLATLVKVMRDDDAETSIEGLKLFQALFVLVDGELSRTRLFADVPPFYRRLASHAQAALIHRQLVGSGINDTFFEWAFNNSAEQFYWQSLADMRLEPRWNPELLAADQMKADFVGRIIIAATKYVGHIEGLELQKLILGTEGSSLLSLYKFPLTYLLPGPLEGALDNPNSLPDELKNAVEERLSLEEVSPSSFIALINSARIFQIDSSHVAAAAEALRLAKHKLSQVDDRDELLAVLKGLAELSAVVRGIDLADELRILVRGYMRDPQFTLSVDEAMRICLVAAASHKDLQAWTIFSGEWLTELAFGELEGQDGQILCSHIHCLLQAVPELWASCAKADAALAAYNSR